MLEQNSWVTSYSLFHILATKPNYHQLEHLNRIEKKTVKSSINPMTGFDCKDMKYTTDPVVFGQLGLRRRLSRCKEKGLYNYGILCLKHKQSSQYLNTSVLR